MQAFDTTQNRCSIAFTGCLAKQVFSIQPSQPGFRQTQSENGDILEDGTS